MRLSALPTLLAIVASAFWLLTRSLRGRAP
jgi:hypothetical protein